MNAINDYLITPIFWNWLVLAVVLFLFEILGTTLFFMFWGVAAIFLAIATAINPTMSALSQIIIFSLLSLLAIVSWWHFVVKRWQHDKYDSSSKLNNRAINLIGRRLKLEKAIVNGYAQIQIDGTTWTVSGDDMDKNTVVEVFGVDSLILKVRRIS